MRSSRNVMFCHGPPCLRSRRRPGPTSTALSLLPSPRPPSPTACTHLVSACFRGARRFGRTTLRAPFGKLRTGPFVTPDLIRGPALVLAAASAVDPVLHRLRQAQTIRDGPRIKSGATVVAARCEAVEDGCANPAGLGGRGDERGLIDLLYPFCSIRRRLVRQAGPCFARIARGCGRVSAPARFARLIARARLRAYLSCPFLRGP